MYLLPLLTLSVVEITWLVFSHSCMRVYSQKLLSRLFKNNFWTRKLSKRKFFLDKSPYWHQNGAAFDFACWTISLEFHANICACFYFQIHDMPTLHMTMYIESTSVLFCGLSLIFFYRVIEHYLLRMGWEKWAWQKFFCE